MTPATMTENMESRLQSTMGLDKNFQMQKLLMIRLACIQVRRELETIYGIFIICFANSVLNSFCDAFVPCLW